MGQAKKRRACPAVNREITAAECGENRHSRYSCPESCPFNPFASASYTHLLQAEDALDLACVKRLVGENPGLAPEFTGARESQGDHGWHAAIVWHLFFARDHDGRTFGDRWRLAGFAGLKNDERVLLQGKMQLQIALLEVHRILDDQRLEAVDLLNPTAGTMLLVDRSVAAEAVRFTTMLTWIYPLPHFRRMSGTGITVSDLGPFTPLEMLEACVEHLGGPPGDEERRRWLAENFTRIHESLTATAAERRRQMLMELDASFGAATYELATSFKEARRMLAQDPAIDGDELQGDEQAKGFREAMVWFEPQPAGGPVSAFSGRRVLGRVLLGANEWRVEALGAARLDDLRERFEARLGQCVRFVRERRDNLAGQIAAREPAVNLALVPPRLLAKPSKLEMSSSRLEPPPAGMNLDDYQAEMLNQQRREWIDEPLPALDGCTAREAAKRPEMRTRLLELVKGHVRQIDTQNLETGRTDDANAMIRALGLAELDFPPPPPRPPTKLDRGMDEEEEDDGDDAGDDPIAPPPRRIPTGAEAGWSAPPLPREPLSMDDAVSRLRSGMDAFATAAEAIDEIESSGSTVFDDVHALAGAELDERHISYLIVFVVQVWFALVPRGRPAPALLHAAMAADVARDRTELWGKAPASEAVMKRLMTNSPQPNLVHAIMAAVVSSVEKAPAVMRPSPVEAFEMILILKALIAEIDRALRRS